MSFLPLKYFGQPIEFAPAKLSKSTDFSSLFDGPHGCFICHQKGRIWTFIKSGIYYLTVEAKLSRSRIAFFFQERAVGSDNNDYFDGLVFFPKRFYGYHRGKAKAVAFVMCVDRELEEKLQERNNCIT